MALEHSCRTAVVLTAVFAAALLPAASFAEEGASIGIDGRVNTGEQRLGVGTKLDASPGGVRAGADATNSEPNLRDQTSGGNVGSANLGGGRQGVRAGAGVETRSTGADPDGNVQGR
jgi:hypothetical protein